MARKLLVRTPQTTDGINLAYDDDRQVIYIESYAELGAKANLESINAKMPKHLHSDILEVDVEFDKLGNVIKPKAEEPAAPKEKADDVIAKIKTAITKEEVAKLIEGDERKTVLDAAAKKTAELTNE